jgi:CMP-N-acetylneuraminic acid synthetase
MNIIAIVPARIGSQRLPKKNLREIQGVSLLAHAVRKSLEARCFTSVVVNSDSPDIGAIGAAEGAIFYLRKPELANHVATSDDYIADFLENTDCDFLVQVHSIAPLLKVVEISRFVARLRENEFDVLLSGVEEQIECIYDGVPVNFSYDRKTNSQDLKPVKRVTWSLSAWRRSTFLAARNSGNCATYAGRVGFFALERNSGIIVKHEEDLVQASALFSCVFPEGYR